MCYVNNNVHCPKMQPGSLKIYLLWDRQTHRFEIISSDFKNCHIISGTLLSPSLDAMAKLLHLFLLTLSRTERVLDTKEMSWDTEVKCTVSWRLSEIVCVRLTHWQASGTGRAYPGWLGNLLHSLRKSLWCGQVPHLQDWAPHYLGINCVMNVTNPCIDKHSLGKIQQASIIVNNNNKISI